MTLKRGAKVSGVSDLDLDKDIQTAGCRTDPNRAKCGHQTPITGEKWAKQDIKATHPLPERTPPRNKVSGTCKCWPRSSWIPFGVILGRFFFCPFRAVEGPGPANLSQPGPQGERTKSCRGQNDMGQSDEEALPPPTPGMTA